MRRLAVICISILAPLLACAHGLLLDAESDGPTITGTAYYSNGDKAANEALSLLDLTTNDATPVAAQTDAEGNFRFSVTASHRYRIVVYGEEGHQVELELLAQAKSKPKLIDQDAAVEEKSWLPPAWALISGVLLISLVPALLSRRRGNPGASGVRG